ncbi:hypothetical protein FOL47_002605, partial [Perkinsus chesapeaki]
MELVHSGGKRVYCIYDAVQPFVGQDASVVVDEECRIVEDSKGALDFHFFHGITISSDLAELNIPTPNARYDIYYLKLGRKGRQHDDTNLDVHPAASAKPSPFATEEGDEMEALRAAERM